MASLFQDIRFGIRTLARTPGFTVIAAAVLALGIGVNTTVFTVANAFFLRPLPVRDPSSFVRVYANSFSNMRYRMIRELRERNSTMEAVAAYSPRSFGLRVDADTEHVFGELVTGNYFQVIGISASRGRVLQPDDDRPGAAGAVVLSDAFWKRRFAADPGTVGRMILLNGQSFTIAGVAPEGFNGLMGPLVADLWVPLASDAMLRPGLDPTARLDSQSMQVIGRLKAGTSLAQAQSDLDTIGRQVRTSFGEPDQGVAVSVYHATMLPPEISRPVAVFTSVLMAVVALVLLIVCVNVANLVLARAAGRDREIAVRQSLGAGRGRLVRQLLTENLILSLGGAAAGLAIASWSTRLLMAIPIPAPVPVALNLALDTRVVAFTAFVAVLATVAFGMLPALTASRVDLVAALKGGGGDGRRQGRLRTAFLVGQVAMSVLLLVMAGLAIRSVRSAQSIDTGFDSAGVVTASLDLDTRGYSTERGREFVRTLLERLESAPGITAANAVDLVPLTLSNTTTYQLRDGDQVPAEGTRPPTPIVYVNAVSPGHFRTLKIPLLAGRDFTNTDTFAGRRVAIINETMARQFWPGKDAIGQRLHSLDDFQEITEVVAVVRDSKYVTVGEEARPFMYRPLAQAYTPRIALLVRGAGSTSDTLGAVRREIAALDSGLATFATSSLDAATAVSLLPARVAGWLLGGLGLLALVLAALGVYGVLSFLVRSRTREIGVRVAIGATPRSVAGMVVRQAMVWTITGMGIGLALAFGVSRFLGALLYGVSPGDPLTYGSVIVLLGAIACIAALVPAVRASRLDPLEALRML